MSIRNRFTQRELSIILHTIVFIIAIIVFICLPGCTYTRNAPLINHNAPWIQTDLQVKDSANGNTVPVSAVP